jgi:outer membrane protein
MMEKLRDPKNVKFISLLIAAIFVIGCFTIALTSGGFGSGVASAASSNSAIGVVNYQMLVSQAPELATIRSTMQTEIQNTRKEFDEKSKDMNATEKERYYKQLQERLGNREKELMDPVIKNIEAAIKKVADKKGLSVVVDKNTVIYGGTDITDEVSKSISGGAKK